MKGVSVTKAGCEIKDFSIPEPGENELVIKNYAVASNPKDWKMAQWGMFEGVEGNDIAGEVASIGKGVTGFKKGDKVAAFTKMATSDAYGAYQEYSLTPAHTTWHVSENVSYEDAATLPLAVMTAAIGLFIELGLTPPATPDPSKTADPKAVVVVNGASSSVGTFTVQLLKLAKYKVVGTAGSSGAVAKEMGADTVVDYRGKSIDELSKAILEAAKELGDGSVKAVYDAVSEGDSVKMLSKVLQPQGGLLTTVLPPPTEKFEENVQVKQTYVGKAYGEHTEFATKWYPQIGDWLNQGIFKPNRVKIMPKGLASVEEGLKLLQGNKVSGEKLVYRIADTPGL